MPDTRKNSSSARLRTDRFRTALLATAVVLVALDAASLSGLRTRLWGTHLYAFLPLPVAIVAWTILAAAAVVLVRRAAPKRDVAAPLPPAFTATIAAVGAVAFAALFWVLRSRQTLLGDAVPLMIDLPGGKAFHPRQPVAMWIQQQLYQGVGGWFRSDGVSDQDVAGNAVALGSVAAGAVFVALAASLGHALTRGARAGRATPWLAALVLLAQGYIVLVFGYVENYAYYLVAIAAYLLCALLYLERRLPLAVPAVALVVAVGVHLSSIALVPSFLFLVVDAWRDRSRRNQAVAATVTLVACALALDRVLRTMSPDFTLWSACADIAHIARTSQGGGAGLSYMFSATHIRDFVSEMFLIGPLGSLLLLPAAVFALSDRTLRRRPIVLFLLIASGCYMAGNWAASEPLLGYARDWDLFAPAGVCYCATVVFLIAHEDVAARRGSRLLAFALVLSLVQVVPWVWINHSEARSIDRFATLPLGGGRTETTLGNFYFRRSDDANAELWFKRALAVDPTNPNANSLLGRLYALRGDYAPAAEYMRRAVLVRPDKASLRRDYVLVLVQMKRCADALPHLLWLADRQPEDVNYWQSMGETMVGSGCTDELAKVYAPILEWLERYEAANPSDANAPVHAGAMLDRIGRPEEAVARFRRALSIEPNNAMALYGLGMSLDGLGETDEAHRQLQKFLGLYPDHPQSGAAREALAR